MKVYIQNMVSLRCKLMVKSVLDEMGLAYKSIELGELMLEEPITEENRKILREKLHLSGLELIEDKNAIIIEKIINIVIEMVHYSDEMPNINFSTFLAEKMQQDYHKMSERFSKTKGITIEHFIILHKIEKIKELITYNELNLTEISYKMNYSSVAHLSKQFKQITGLTPTFFKNIGIIKRKNLENI